MISSVFRTWVRGPVHIWGLPLMEMWDSSRYVIETA